MHCGMLMKRLCADHHLVTLGIFAVGISYGIDAVVTGGVRLARPEMWRITEVVIAGAFGIVTWLWLRLRETQGALTDLERQQIVTNTQLTIAARVQTALLPRMPQHLGGVSWYGAVEPVYTVGGDYYDLIRLSNDRTCVVLADVSGKGMPAAVFVANVRAILRALVCDASGPAKAVSRLSKSLLADSSTELYVTCIVAFVDAAQRSLVYVNAGQPPGVLWRRDGHRALRTGGPPVGLVADARFEEERVTLEPGDLVVMVSDGITEALDVSGLASVDAIARCIEAAETRTPEAVCGRLLGAAGRGRGPTGISGWADDRTAVAFELLD